MGAQQLRDARPTHRRRTPCNLDCGWGGYRVSRRPRLRVLDRGWRRSRNRRIALKEDGCLYVLMCCRMSAMLSVVMLPDDVCLGQFRGWTGRQVGRSGRERSTHFGESKPIRQAATPPQIAVLRQDLYSTRHSAHELKHMPEGCLKAEA